MQRPGNETTCCVHIFMDSNCNSDNNLVVILSQLAFHTCVNGLTKCNIYLKVGRPMQRHFGLSRLSV